MEILTDARRADKTLGTRLETASILRIFKEGPAPGLNKKCFPPIKFDAGCRGRVGAGTENADDLVEEVSRLATANFTRNHRTCTAGSSKSGRIRAGPRLRQGFCARARSMSPDVPYALVVFLCLPSHRKPELPIKGLSLLNNPFQQSFVCFSPHLLVFQSPTQECGGVPCSAQLTGPALKGVQRRRNRNKGRVQHESRAQAGQSLMEGFS